MQAPPVHLVPSDSLLDEGVGLGWDGVNFLPNRPYDAMLRICGWNSADDTLMFWLLLKRACTAPRLSLFPTLPISHSSWLGRARGCEGTQPGQLTKGIFHTMSCSATKPKEKRREKACFWLWCLSSEASVRNADVFLAEKWLNICLRIRSRG